MASSLCVLGALTPRSEDAEAAMNNMHNAECACSALSWRLRRALMPLSPAVYGRVLRVNLAQPDKTGKAGEPVWRDPEAYEDLGGS